MSVKDGVITSISPTAISAFDETTAFGCERRWWFKYVAGLKEPTSVKMDLGTKLHAANEELLKGVWPRTKLEGPVSILFERGAGYVETVKQLAIGVEAPMPTGFNIAGIPISSMSKCDVVTKEPGIVDWKTTSSIDKYGKTPGQLRKDTQMIIYARAFHPDAEKVRLTHGQYETSGTPRFNRASVVVEKNQLDEYYLGTIIPLVERMKTAARVEAAREMKPNRNACRLCPHKGICPPDKENSLMGLFNKYKTSTEAPATPAAPSKPEPQILPPDAPASVPELAAKPVEGFELKKEPAKRQLVVVEEKPEVKEEPKAEVEEKFEPVPPPAEKKKGPGRPAGSKNKPKETPVAGTNNAAIPEAVGEVRFVEDTDRFTETTVSYGVTMNTGDFNSVRIDVSHTIKHSGDVDSAYATALDKCKEQIEAEMKKVAEGLKLSKGGK